MPTDDRPAELRFRTLEAAVMELTVNVHSLVEALRVVGALTAAQQEQAVRQAVTEDEAENAQALALARYKRINMVQRLTAIAVAVAVPAVSLLAYWSLAVQVDQQFAKQQDDLTASCQLRNEANVFIPRRRELALAAAYESTNPTVAAIHRESADALAKVAVDCSIYKTVTR